jgi:diguanylate cyclase (GGDEF)-like protein
MNRAFKFIMVAVVLLGVFLSLLVGWRFRVVEKRELMSEFRRVIDAKAVAFEREISLNLEVLFAFKSLFSASRKVEKSEFRTAAFEAMQRHKGIRALGWVPQVNGEEPRTFESRRFADNPAFRFPEVSKSGWRIAAVRREKYYPIYFLEPEESFLQMVGFDLGTDPVFRSLLDDARDNNSLQVAGFSGRSGFNNTDQATFFGLLPVYSGRPDTVASRRKNLRGFILGVFDFTALFEAAGWSGFQDLSAVRLIGDGRFGANGELYVHRGQKDVSLPAGFAYERDVRVADKPAWQLQAVPISDYFSRYRSMTPWLYVSAISFIALMILSYLWLMAKHAASVETLVSQRTRELDEANRKLASLSLTDGLTGIANRRYFDDYLTQEWKRTQREKQPLSLIMVDIDHFKAYNDYYGHQAGDDCLRQVARLLQTVVARPGDLVARYGGEEFALILPQTQNGAKKLGECCRATVAGSKIPHHASPVRPVVTVSVGVATMTPAVGEEPSRLVKTADQALYRAKLLGRNHVVMESVHNHCDGSSKPATSPPH